MSIEQAEFAEKNVLGAMLRSAERIADVVQTLKAEHFRSDRHQRIFKAMVALFEKGEPVDAPLLADHMKHEIEDIGGYRYLGELLAEAPTGGNCQFYAEVVKDYGLARALKSAAEKIAHDAEHHVAPASELLEAAEREIFSLAQMGAEGSTITLAQMMAAAQDRLDARAAGNVANGLSTGFSDIDFLLGGLHEGELVIVAARPGCGKTAFALGIAQHVCMNLGTSVFFASLEQGQAELADRLLCARAMVDGHKLRRGNANYGEVKSLMDAIRELREGRLFVDDGAAQGMLRIAANARRLKAKHGVGLVIVDYLQLIEPDNRKAPRHEQVGAISRRLKGLARELSVPVVALAQLNRASEDRKEGRPRLSDLRESGSIEADADAVLLLHRPEMYKDRAGNHDAENADRLGEVDAIVAKQRNGPTGEVTLRFNSPCMVFQDFLARIPEASMN